MANVGSEIKKTLHLWNKSRSEWNIQRTRKETQKLKIQQIKYQTDSKVEKSPREYITKDRDMKNERWEKSADASTRPNIWIISSRRQKTEARHTPRHIFKSENENEASTLEGVREKQHRSGNQNALKKVSPGCHDFQLEGTAFQSEILCLPTTIGDQNEDLVRSTGTDTLYQEAIGDDLPRWEMNQERQRDSTQVRRKGRPQMMGKETRGQLGPEPGSSQSWIEQESEGPGGMLPRKLPIW